MTSTRSGDAFALNDAQIANGDVLPPSPPPPPPLPPKPNNITTAAAASNHPAVGRPSFDYRHHQLHLPYPYDQQRRLRDEEEAFFSRPNDHRLFAPHFNLNRDIDVFNDDPFPTFDPLPFPAAGRISDVAMLSARDSQHELSPKAKVTYDEGKFQVEFDVQDYRPEELSIKTEGDVLIVLAKHETKTENGGSFVSKQFEQRFTLPSGVKPEQITSALSKEGMLVVTAPRELPAVKRITDNNSSSSNNNNNAVYAHSNDQQEEGLPHPRVKYDEDKFQISLDCHKYKPEELDVKVEGSTIIITAKQESKESGGTRTRVFEQKFTLPSGVKADKVTSTFSREGYLTITAPRGLNANTVPQSSIEQRMDRVLSPSNWDNNFSSSSSSTSSNRQQQQQQQQQRDHFDRDLEHFGGKHHMPSIFDHHHHHRDAGLYGGGPSADGISKVQLTDDEYRILVNVDGFEPEELIIKTVGQTVHFEAKHEQKTSDGHSYTSRNISQSFTLPRGVDPESVTSSLSKEGVLTIAAPLPPALKVQSHERLVPIKHR